MMSVFAVVLTVKGLWEMLLYIGIVRTTVNRLSDIERYMCIIYEATRRFVGKLDELL